MRERAELLSLMDHIPGQQVDVIGDLVLDRYVVGRAARVSREAPVLVLEERESFVRPGSAANPAVNLAGLGCAVRVLGVVGSDAEGVALCDALAVAGVDVSRVVVNDMRPTQCKTRFLADDGAGRRQQVLRLDRVGSQRLTGDTLEALEVAIAETTHARAALILSDYKGGVICERTIGAALSSAADSGRPLLVDTQGDPLRFRGFGLVKCNLPDAEAALGVELKNDAAVRQACHQLLEELDAGAVVMTLGADGLAALGGDGRYVRLQAENRAEVVDVTGAGDTVIALLAAALSAGATLPQAARLANLAAGLVVRRFGVAAASPSDLRLAISEAFPT